MPVPGMPTPMAFFNIFALRCRMILSGVFPSTSAHFAAQRATAIGSVHPIAGTTSRFIRSMICLRFFSGNMILKVKMQQSYIKFF